MEAVREQYPHTRPRADGELDVVIEGLRSGDTHYYSLDRAYQEFEKNPADVDEILKRWLGFIADFENPSDIPGKLAGLVPMIKDRSWVEAQREAARLGNAQLEMWIEDYNTDLIVAYAEFRSGIHYPSKDDFAMLGKSNAELREIALRNLRQRTCQRSVVGGDGSYLVGAGGNLEASLLLDDELWHDARLRVRGKVLVGVPDRDSLVVSGDADPVRVFEIAAAVTRLYRSERYPISDKLFIRSGDRFQPLDGGLVDDGHPVPNLDVIDVYGKKKGGGATLGLVIASPISADARSIYRLFRKLNGYLNYISSSEYKDECGVPNPDTTQIVVNAHTALDQRVIDLLNSISPWVRQQQASLKIEYLHR